jgi:hypothetical protein
VVWGFWVAIHGVVVTSKNELSHIIKSSIPKSVNLEQRGSQPISKNKSERWTTEFAVPIKRITSAAIAYRHV